MEIKREGNWEGRCVCISHNDVSNHQLLILLCFPSHRKLCQHLLNPQSLMTSQFS